MVVALAILCGLSTSAQASDNTGPARAIPINAGVPFSGDWAGTPRQHRTDCCDYWHWYRPTFPLRNGDTVQLAIDNTTSDQSTQACFVGPVDEFGADTALENDCHTDAFVDDHAAGRESLVYDDSQPNGFLVVRAFFCCGEIAGQYTMTVERVITRINIGLVPPQRVSRSFTLTASLRYGDNTPAADGSVASLFWRRHKDSPGPQAFTSLASASSSGGMVNFSASLPDSAGPEVELRACAPQPGGTESRCTSTFTVSVLSRSSGQPVPAACPAGNSAGVRCLSRADGSLEIHGTAGNDRVVGSELGDLIGGKNGNDWIDARGGDDDVRAGHGNDHVGGRGGADKLRGGPGNDRLWGDGGNDRLFGEQGNDRLTPGNGYDRLKCDSGRDRALQVSRVDLVNRDCELR